MDDGKPKRPGRPPAAGVKRSKVLQVRGTPDELESWTRAASDAGAATSEWARGALNDRAARTRRRKR